MLSHTTGFYTRLRNDLYCVEWGVKLYSLTGYYNDSWGEAAAGAVSTRPRSLAIVPSYR